MGLKTAIYEIDCAALPQQSPFLGLRFERKSIITLKASSPPKDMMVITPATSLLSEEDSVGSEPYFKHIMCGIKLVVMNGTTAEGSGQLLITGHRIIGMIDTGKATNSPPLSPGPSSTVFCFAFHQDDAYPLTLVRKNRLMPSVFLFRGREELAVGFQCGIFAAVAFIANGKMGYWSDKSMLKTMSDEGRRSLLRNPPSS